MIKAIIFDLDGVLVNTRELHYESFHRAYMEVTEDTSLTWKLHSDLYDGLSTKQKLQKMIMNGIITQEQSEFIFLQKQTITKELIVRYVHPRPYLITLMKLLQDMGLRLACASNSVRESLDLILDRLQISSYLSLTLSNNDVSSPKPSPEIYRMCFSKLNINSDECLICEDSVHGREAAYMSGANVLEIEDAEDLTIEKIKEKLENKSTTKKRVQIVIPMAGEGSRFRSQGYTVPKPFIDVFGKPMIVWVIQNLLVKSDEFNLEFIFLCRKSHLEEYDADHLFSSLGIHYTILPIDNLTEGAACTVLLAKDLLRTNDPLLIVNSDQYLEWDPLIFYKVLSNETYDGVISTFYSPDPSDTKWSFVKLNENLLVSSVAEKVWIGPNATTGIYGFKRASDFIKYSEQMIAKEIRIKNEFYVCPVYNEAIQDNKKIRCLECKKLWGLGVPEDLQYFLSHFPYTTA